MKLAPAWKTFAAFADRYQEMARAKQVVHWKGLRLLTAMYRIRDEVRTARECKRIAAKIIKDIESEP